MDCTFIHLHLHSEFSIEDGLVRIPDLMSQVKKFEMPAVALTDLSNLFGLVKLITKAKLKGVEEKLGKVDGVLKDTAPEEESKQSFSPN